MSATGRANGRSSFSLESLHLYRKVPRYLTDATRLGGLISIACAFMMTYLFISNISEYMQMKTTTDVALDDTGEVSMRIFFNITMVRRQARLRAAQALRAALSLWDDGVGTAAR